MKKLIFPIAIVIFLALLSGCINIDSVSQPTSAIAGDTITTTIQVSLANNTSGEYFPPAFAVKIPNDWTVVSVYYSGTGGASGISEFLSQNSTASFDIESEFPSGPSYLWLGYSGTAKRVDVLPAGITVTIKLRTGAVTGNYDINYTVGFFGWGNWIWTDPELRPITVSSLPTTGNISITSSPSGAEVFVDGVSKGTAPITVSNIALGSHAVKCRLSGYLDNETTVNVVAGGVAPVTCMLIHKPMLSISPDPISLNLGTMSAGESSSQKFSISNAGGGTLEWRANDDQPWITLNPTSGTNSGTVTLNINTTGLSPGSYSGTIIITSNGETKKGSISLNIQAIPAPTTPAPVTTTPTPTPTAYPGGEGATPTPQIPDGNIDTNVIVALIGALATIIVGYLGYRAAKNK